VCDKIQNVVGSIFDRSKVLLRAVDKAEFVCDERSVLFRVLFCDPFLSVALRCVALFKWR